jgi:hypothetical protein
MPPQRVHRPDAAMGVDRSEGPGVVPTSVSGQGHRAGWLLYDGSCGVCSRGVSAWAPTLDRYGIGIAPLQSDWVRTQLNVSDAELLADVRLLARVADSKTGRHENLGPYQQIVGADVYRYIMRRIWWAYPLYLLTRVPGLRTLYEWGYRRFAERRYHISRVCRLDPR